MNKHDDISIQSTIGDKFFIKSRLSLKPISSGYNQESFIPIDKFTFKYDRSNHW